MHSDKGTHENIVNQNPIKDLSHEQAGILLCSCSNSSLFVLFNWFIDSSAEAQVNSAAADARFVSDQTSESHFNPNHVNFQFPSPEKTVWECSMLKMEHIVICENSLLYKPQIARGHTMWKSSSHTISEVTQYYNRRDKWAHSASSFCLSSVGVLLDAMWNIADREARECEKSDITYCNGGAKAMGAGLLSSSKSQTDSTKSHFVGNGNDQLFPRLLIP